FLGKTYTEFQPVLTEDSIVVVRGRVNARDDGKVIHANALTVPDLSGVSPDTVPLPLTVTIPEQNATTDVVQALGDILIRHEGDTEVRLRLVRDGAARVFELPYRITRSQGLTGELKTLL